MADKNYIKALRRAKARRNFYTSLMVFIPIGFTLFFLNITVVGRNMPWSMIPISIFGIVIVIQRLLIFRKPQRHVFSKDYLEYQTEKELRLLEFEDDVDEQDAERLELGHLDLQPLKRNLDEGMV